jgi:hypothetical protein
MGRKIPDSNGGGGSFNPTALLKEKGAELKGIYLEKREAKTLYGMKPVYTFTVLDAACRFTSGGVEVQPEEGAKIDFFAPTRLERQLQHVKIGETVVIKYAGTKKAGTGMPAHCFDVEVQ